MVMAPPSNCAICRYSAWRPISCCGRKEHNARIVGRHRKRRRCWSWYEQRSPHTKAYDEYLLKQLVNSTIEDVSLKEHIGYDAVVGALNHQIEVAINWDEIADLHTVGIDEIALTKGHKEYAAIVTTKQTNGKVRVLAVLPDRKKRV